MPSTAEPVRSLSDAQLQQFIQDGFVRIDKAFPRELADQGRAILWRDTGCDPDDSATWTKPVIRLGYYGQEPFKKAVNTPVLHGAFDQLVGKGRWRPRPIWGPFRCGFRVRTIPETPVGTSMSAFPASQKTHKRKMTIRRGG